MMTRSDIEQLVSTGELVIEPFLPEDFKATAYSVHLGDEAALAGAEGLTEIEDGNTLDLAPGRLAVVKSEEWFSLPLNVSAIVGVRSSLLRKGLIPLNGLLIDPGFRGVLVLGLFNSSQRTIKLRRRDPFATLAFFTHSATPQESAKVIYEPEQDRRRIPDRDVSYLQSLTQVRPIHVIDEQLEETTKRTRGLRGSIRWGFGLLVTLVVTLVLGVMPGVFLVTNHFEAAADKRVERAIDDVRQELDAFRTDMRREIEQWRLDSLPEPQEGP